MSNKKIIFNGVGVALITPFKNNQVDVGSLTKIVNHLLKNKVDAIVVLGTTGEPPTLSQTEKELIVNTVLKVNNNSSHKAKIILGVGSNSTEHAIELAKWAQQFKVDGLLVVTPYYNKATQNGVVAHYQAIAQAVNTPLIVYNVPGRTGVNIAPQTLEKIAQIKTVVGYKEACGDISHNLYTQQVCQRNNIGFYSGNDDLNFLTYANRGNGTISVVANVFPDLCVKMWNLVQEQKIWLAQQLHDKLLEVNNEMFIEVNPIPVKSAMAYYGFCTNEMRLPLTVIEPQHELVLHNALAKIKKGGKHETNNRRG